MPREGISGLVIDVAFLRRVISLNCCALERAFLEIITCNENRQAD